MSNGKSTYDQVIEYAHYLTTCFPNMNYTQFRQDMELFQQRLESERYRDQIMGLNATRRAWEKRRRDMINDNIDDRPAPEDVVTAMLGEMDKLAASVEEYYTGRGVKALTEVRPYVSRDQSQSH